MPLKPFETLLMESIMDNSSKTYYHVTPTKNEKSILSIGLEPRIGANSKSVKERRPGVYLFNDKNSMHDAMTGWLGHAIGDEEPISYLEVKVPKHFDHATDVDVPCHTIVREHIPPAHIKVIGRE